MAEVTISREAAERAARVLADADPSTKKKWDDLQPGAQYQWAVRAKAALAAAARLIVADDLEMLTGIIQEISDANAQRGFDALSAADVLHQYRRRVELLRAQS